MFEFRKTLIIRRPPRDVFELLARFEDAPKYVPQLVSAEQVGEGPVSVGTTFIQRGRLFGRTIETPTVVTTFEPHRRFGYRAERGPVPYEAVYELRPTDGSTELEAHVRLSMHGRAGALEPLLGPLISRLYGRNLGLMRQLLEGAGGPG